MKVGVVSKIGKAADDRVIEAKLHPSHCAQASGDRRSIHATANDPVFQELAVALRPVGTGVQARISVAANYHTYVVVTLTDAKCHTKRVDLRSQSQSQIKLNNAPYVVKKLFVGVCDSHCDRRQRSKLR